jgi:hypothetical protein
VKLQLNEALTDDQFVLEQPHGAEVIRLDRLDQPDANRERGYGGTR